MKSLVLALLFSFLPFNAWSMDSTDFKPYRTLKITLPNNQTLYKFRYSTHTLSDVLRDLPYDFGEYYAVLFLGEDELGVVGADIAITSQLAILDQVDSNQNDSKKKLNLKLRESTVSDVDFFKVFKERTKKEHCFNAILADQFNTKLFQELYSVKKLINYEAGKENKVSETGKCIACKNKYYALRCKILPPRLLSFIRQSADKKTSTLNKLNKCLVELNEDSSHNREELQEFNQLYCFREYLFQNL